MTGLGNDLRSASRSLASLAGAVAVLLGAAALACAIPARRASRIDPMAALKTE